MNTPAKDTANATIEVDTIFGKQSIDPSQIITFPRGIPGFENSTKWKLFHEVDESGKPVYGVVIHMLSINDGNISLSLTDPALFGFNFEMVLSDAEVAELKLEDPKDLIVLTVLSSKKEAKPQNGPQMMSTYANISAPILINAKSHIGIQKVLAVIESRVDLRTAVAA